jgi:hypothetical protein
MFASTVNFAKKIEQDVFDNQEYPMTPEGHNELMPAIEAVLKEATDPMDCIQLFEVPAIKAIAPSANRVSDYLGVMFRKGILSRVAGSTTNSKARWAYVYRHKQNPTWKIPKDKELLEFRPKATVDRPDLYIAENGEYINIELPGFSITIKAKK